MDFNKNTEELMLHTAKNRIVDLDNAASNFSNVKDYLAADKDFEEEWRAKYYSSPEINRIRSASEYDREYAKLSKDKYFFELAESGESSGYFRESVIIHEIVSSVKLNAFMLLWIVPTIVLCILFNRVFTTDLDSVDTSRFWSYSSENTDNIYYDDVTFSEYPSLLDDVNKIQELISSSINNDLKYDNLFFDNSFEDVLSKLLLEKYNQIFIIGGESIYKKALGYADSIYITHINKDYNCDRFFPEIDRSLFNSNKLKSFIYNDINVDIVEYSRKKIVQ